jgi:hypothetical protein
MMDHIQLWEDFVSRKMCLEQFIVLYHGLVCCGSKMACFWPSNLKKVFSNQGRFSIKSLECKNGGPLWIILPQSRSQHVVGDLAIGKQHRLGHCGDKTLP